MIVLKTPAFKGGFDQHLHEIDGHHISFYPGSKKTRVGEDKKGGDRGQIGCDQDERVDNKAILAIGRK